VTRLRELLVSVFPGLEAALDLTKKGPLFAVSRVARPVATRRLGEARLTRWLEARGVYGAKKLAGRIVAAAKAQRRELPAAETKATLIAEIASEVLRTKKRIDALEARLVERVEANPQGKVVMSLPGMGTIMTAEFLAEADDLSRFGSPDRFAAAAGIAPVLKASGSVSYRRRAKRGNRVLKRVFYQSAHCAVLCHERSRAFYRRKRGEGRGTPERRSCRSRVPHRSVQQPCSNLSK
jgi:transposase